MYKDVAEYILDPIIQTNVLLYHLRGKLTKGKPHQTHPYGTQSKI